MDVLTPAQRQLNMSRIRSRDTQPELLIRRGLHAQGFRFRLHQRQLPGRPDLVLARHRTVVFVNGCFWHSHGCHISRMPETRRDYWQPKLDRTVERDRDAASELRTRGWRIVTVWECAVRGRTRLVLDDVIAKIERFVRFGTDATLAIAGAEADLEPAS
jgi:DNA mismatch endonuclease, patch repair protein